MDTSRYARFLRPGHAVTQDRRRTAEEKRDAVGYDYAHAIVDDHSRLAYVELHDDEKAATVTGFVERALDFFAKHFEEVERSPKFSRHFVEFGGRDFQFAMRFFQAGGVLPDFVAA